MGPLCLWQCLVNIVNNIVYTYLLKGVASQLFYNPENMLDGVKQSQNSNDNDSLSFSLISFSISISIALLANASMAPYLVITCVHRCSSNGRLLLHKKDDMAESLEQFKVMI